MTGADERFAEDVYLACACGAGNPAALLAFDRQFLAEVPHFIARVDPSPTVAEEVKQALREHLLVATPAGPPRITEYAGRGSLGGWIRISAVRRLHRMRKRLGSRVAANDVVADRLVAVDADPETALIKKRHGADLADAVRTGLAALPTRDRTLLKMHIVDGLGIDELCLLHGVHRATVARWIVRLRQQLLDEAMRVLKARLELDTAEADSLCAALCSQLDVSLGALVDES